MRTYSSRRCAGRGRSVVAPGLCRLTASATPAASGSASAVAAASGAAVASGAAAASSAAAAVLALASTDPSGANTTDRTGPTEPASVSPNGRGADRWEDVPQPHGAVLAGGRQQPATGCAYGRRPVRPGCRRAGRSRGFVRRRRLPPPPGRRRSSVVAVGRGRRRIRHGRPNGLGDVPRSGSLPAAVDDLWRQGRFDDTIRT
jgi:hypothetical protein